MTEENMFEPQEEMPADGMTEENPDAQESTEAEMTEETETEGACADEAADEDAASEEETEEDGTAAEAEETGEQNPEGKGGFFSRRKDKEKAALKERVDELEDRVKRQMAEFDNFRKRTEKEKEQMFSMGEKSVLEKMLPILDNFERGFDTVAEEDGEDAFVEGMRKIYAQLLKQMEDIGVKPIEAVGKEFDPNLHNAVMQVESEELESGMVAQELLKGYMFHDSVLRHSMVSVVS